MSLIAIKSIRKEYRNKTVLADVTLQVEKGDRIALIGANGSGKSTLLKIMMGVETADTGEVYRPKRIRVGYLSQSLDHYDHEEFNALHYEALFDLENKIRLLEKDLEEYDYTSDDYQVIMDDYSKQIQKFEEMDGYVLQNKIKKILLGLGLRKGALLIPLQKLSGGEKMRVALARILLKEPDLLILDEPTNHLDIKAIEWLESYLQKFSGGVLMVSHDRLFLDRVTTRIGEIQGGHLTTKKCNYTSYLQQKSRLRDFYFKEQKNLQKQIRSEKLMVEKLRKYKKIKQSQSREKQLKKLEEKAAAMMSQLRSSENLKHISGPGLKFDQNFHLSHEVVTFKDLHKHYGDYHILKGINLTIYGGEKVAIIGPNGCGKTTLLNIMLGKDKDFKGVVRFGSWIKYAYLGQEVTFDNEELTVIETVMESLKLDEVKSKILLSKFQFYGDVIHSKINILSGGERVRIKLMAMMHSNPHCLILDEPTNHLDLESRIAIEKSINDYPGTVIAVSHDRYFLKHCVKRIIEIDSGSLISHKEPVKKRPVVKTSKKVEVKKVDSSQIEKDIETVEGLLEAFELSINPTYTLEDYQGYDMLLKERDDLYLQLEALVEE